MKYLSYKSAFFLLGTIWLVVGTMLLSKGIQFTLVSAVSDTLTKRVFSLLPRQESCFILICLGILLGQIKSRLVLKKNAQRRIAKLKAMKSHLGWHQIFDRSYLILIAAMILIGMSFRFIKLPLDLRGLIDVAIGTALIQGSLVYYKAMKQITVK